MERELATPTTSARFPRSMDLLPQKNVLREKSGQSRVAGLVGPTPYFLYVVLLVSGRAATDRGRDRAARLTLTLAAAASLGITGPCSRKPSAAQSSYCIMLGSAAGLLTCWVVRQMFLFGKTNANE